jgi:[acyl-carrier-protein] S-malonyltransferase
MLQPWLALPGAGTELAAWSEACGLDLLALGTSAGPEEIRDTAVAQPLLTAAALLSWRALDLPAGVVCGHSVGELAALAVAGVLTPRQAVVLAAERGRAMAAAAAVAPTGMAATLGGEAAEVAAAAQALGLEVATVNVAGQTVYGGPVAALDSLAEQRPGGTRVRRLETAGAFHTTAMLPAVARLRELVAAIEPGEPRCQVVANADGMVVRDGRALLDRLVGQLTGPVRFDLCLATLGSLQPTAVVELAPGGTLSALAKRALPGVPLTALKAPSDLPVPA